jgi:histidinol phosphatase-like enzyme (inositol monophosphatase family)
MTTAGSTKGDVLLQAVAEVARRAGKVALSHFRSRLAVETKHDGSPVTIADRAAEQAAREWIGARFPEDGIHGEELGLHNAQAARRWIIDPIDGTKSFVHGVPLWGTLVAVADGPRIVAGAVYCAAVDELVAAAPGLGCWWNGSRCRVSSEDDLARATVLTTDDRFPGRDARRARWSRLAERAAVARTWGDCYGYLLVATGRAHVMVDDRMHAWDVAPLVPIIEEAGGSITDWRGGAIALPTSDAGSYEGDSIAASGALADEVRSIHLDASDDVEPGVGHA